MNAPVPGALGARGAPILMEPIPPPEAGAPAGFLRGLDFSGEQRKKRSSLQPPRHPPPLPGGEVSAGCESLR